MTQTPVTKLVCTLAVPSIISMLITSFYNMADTYFVGRIGTSATAAVGVALPLMSVIQAIGFTLGHGSGNNIARALGRQEKEEALHMAAVGFFSALLLGGALGLLGTVFLDQMVELLGATVTSAPYTKEYIRFILIGAPFMVSSLVLNNQFRFQGNAVFGMVGIFTGAVLNMILDPIFIFGLKMGVGGAALATILSQFVGFCLLLSGTFNPANLSISIRRFRPTLTRYRLILAGGLPSFWRQALASVATILLNVAGREFGGGDAAVAAMSIVSRLTMFAGSALIGFGQGCQPVIGFNYGAKLYGRVRECFLFFFKVGGTAALILSALGFGFAPQLIELFRKGDPAVIEIGALALRMQCVTFPLMAWFFPTSMTLQTIGRAVRATGLAMCRQGLAFLPFILTLPRLWGVLGIQLSQPIADVLTFLVALPLGLSILRELKELDQGQRQAAE